MAWSGVGHSENRSGSGCGSITGGGTGWGNGSPCAGRGSVLTKGGWLLVEVVLPIKVKELFVVQVAMFAQKSRLPRLNIFHRHPIGLGNVVGAA